MKQRKSAVYILLGQSNAVGHGVDLEEKDKILTPMSHVFSLPRKDNQSFDTTCLTFSGYTSFGMNLGEEQDNTYSIPNCLAPLWQGHIDAGNQYDLPDLYIIQIGVGAQGVTKGYMWHPEKPQTIVTGPTGTTDISLYPFTLHIFKMLDDYFTSRNMEYEIIGLDWRGSENDMLTKKDELAAEFKNIYKTMFRDFNEILKNPPIVLHKLACPDRAMDLDPTGQAKENMYYINEIFEELQKEYPNVTLFDYVNSPHYIDGVYGNGLFIEDAVHFSPQVNRWVSQCIIEQYHSKNPT